VVVQAQVLGLRERAFEAVRLRRRGEIQQRPRHRRDGDALMGGRVAGVEAASAVQADATSAVSPARSGHIDVGGRSVEQAPMCSGADVRKDGAGAACHHRSQPPALGTEEHVAHRVHAAIQAVKAAGSGPLLDRAGAEPERRQLRQRDDAPLPPRQVRELAIEGWALFPNHVFA
jgi:hypothetical protein